MHRSIPGLTAALLVALATPATAQQFLGRVGGGCFNVSPSTNLQFIALDQAVPAGATLIVGVAASSSVLSGITVEDPSGNRFQAIGGIHQAAAGALAQFRGALQRPITAGESLQIGYDNVGSGVRSCISVLGYRGVPFGSRVHDAIGSGGGQSSSPALTAGTASPATQHFVIGHFATRAAPGAVNATAPASALPTLCAADNSVCLIDTYYSGSAIGTATTQLSLANSVVWSGVLTAIAADGLFGNGFD